MSRASLFVAAGLTVAAATQSQPTSISDPSRAQKIDEWLHSSIAEDDATKEIAEAKESYEKRGLPTIDEVGDLAAYEFVVLLASKKLPTAFRSEVLSGVKEAAARHQIPSDAATFYETRVRLDELKQEAKAHTPSNPALREEIKRMYESDQAVRQQKGFDVEKMNEIDKQHSGPLKVILDNYGVPTYSMVGSEATEEFIDLIQHQPPTFRQEVLPRLKANVEMGEADPEGYAMAYDRSLRDLGKKQVYGEQLECNTEQQMHEAPIEDETHVNARRAKLGLIRLELYARFLKELMPQFCPPVKPND